MLAEERMLKLITYRPNPHELGLELVFEFAPTVPMPRKKDSISILVLLLVNVSHFTLTKDFCAPVPSICNIGDQDRILGSIVNTCTILAGPC